MNGTLDPTLPSASRTRPNGSFKVRTKVLSSMAFMSAIAFISTWPYPSRAPQRLIEAMQSSEVTGLPSCHSSPSRKVIV